MYVQNVTRGLHKLVISRDHMLIHTGDKHHVCSECDKRFARTGDLKRHMLIHAGDKQQVWPACDQRFT